MALPLDWALVDGLHVHALLYRGPGRRLHATTDGWLWDDSRPEPCPLLLLDLLDEALNDLVRVSRPAVSVTAWVAVDCPAAGIHLDDACAPRVWRPGQLPARAAGEPGEALLALLHETTTTELPPFPHWRVLALRDADAGHVDYLVAPSGDAHASPRRLTLIAAPDSEALRWHCRRLSAFSTCPGIVTYQASRPAPALLQELTDWEPGAPSLAELLDLTPLGVDEALATLHDLALALQAGHERGLAHGQLAAAHVEMGTQGTRLGNYRLPVPAPWRHPGQLPPWPPMPGDDWRAYASLAGLLLDAGAAPPGLDAWLDALRQPETSTDAAGAANARFLDWRQLPEPDGWLPEAAPDDGSPDPVLAAGALVGDFRVLRFLRQGGFAQVYEVVHVLQNRRFALKVYHHDVPADEFTGEFSLLAALDHPHILRAHWSGRLPDGRAYLVLDLLHGHPWSDVAWGEVRLAPRDALELAAQAVEALASLHAAPNPLLHRDLKPANLFAVPGRGAVVIDFNSAARADAADGFPGTPRYVPPDLRRDDGVAWDPSADTYALGVALFELLCHRSPHGKDGAALADAPPWPEPLGDAPLPRPLAALVHRAIQPRAAGRFATAADFAAAIAAARERLTPGTVPLPASLPVVDCNPFVDTLAEPVTTPGFAPAEHLAEHLLALAAPANWRVCHGCRWRARCPIHYNALSFGPHPAGATIRRRLAEHLRQAAMPLPAGELRQLAGWLIGRRLDCAAVSARHATRAPLDLLDDLYWNATAPGLPTPDGLPLAAHLRLDGPRPAVLIRDADALARLPLADWPFLSVPGRPAWPLDTLSDAFAGASSVAMSRRLHGLISRWMWAEHEPAPRLDPQPEVTR